MSDDRRPRLGPRFIMGTGITLRRIERDDLVHIRRWLDDPDLFEQASTAARDQVHRQTGATTRNLELLCRVAGIT